MPRYTIPATKDDILDLINWLQSKPHFSPYDVGSAANCLLVQYLKDRGRERVHATWGQVYADGNTFELPPSIRHIAHGPDGAATFGGALIRAEFELSQMETADAAI